jgi:hypothetical protein
MGGEFQLLVCWLSCTSVYGRSTAVLPHRYTPEVSFTAHSSCSPLPAGISVKDVAKKKKKDKSKSSKSSSKEDGGSGKKKRKKEESEDEGDEEEEEEVSLRRFGGVGGLHQRGCMGDTLRWCHPSDLDCYLTTPE